jgi:hypothetical protein
MNRIFENLQDPSWWFTAIFVAIIVSVFAAYLKEVLSKFLSHFSTRINKWRQKRKWRNYRVAIITGRDPALLLISVVWIIFMFQVWVFMGLFLILLPVYVDVSINRPELFFKFGSSENAIHSVKWMTLAIAFAMIFWGYRTGVRSLEFLRAYAVYLRSKPNNGMHPTADTTVVKF